MVDFINHTDLPSFNEKTEVIEAFYTFARDDSARRRIG